MAILLTTASLAAPIAANDRLWARRAALMTVTAVALGLAWLFGSNLRTPAIDPELARLLRYMALLKAAFAVIALGVCLWRLARPAALWRDVIYVFGPGLMAGGALCLWQLQSAGLAAAALHIGMFALLAAGLTDSGFVPALRRRSA